MGKFKMKGFKAFDMEKNSNNKPDGRAGSSVFQIAGKVYNKFSTSPNKIKVNPPNPGKTKPTVPKLDKATTRSNIGLSEEEVAGMKARRTNRLPQTQNKNKQDVTPQSQGGTGKSGPTRRRYRGKTVASPMPIAMRSVGSSNRLKTRPVRKKSDSSDPFKIQTTTDKQRDVQRQGDYYRSDHQKKKDDRMAQIIKERNKKKNEESPNKIVSKVGKIASRVARPKKKKTTYQDIMKKQNSNIYNIREHSQKQPDGSMGTVVTYQIKGEKGEYAVAKNRLEKRISNQRKKAFDNLKKSFGGKKDN